VRRPELARGALLLLCAYCLFIGFVAVAAPHAFYDDFPFLAHWVDKLPPYNGHLITAWRLQRDLVIAACAGFLTVSVPHLLYHVTHLDGFGAVDGAAELIALASLLVPPVVALWASRPAVPSGPPETRRNS
jgi:hypothetical protein